MVLGVPAGRGSDVAFASGGNCGGGGGSGVGGGTQAVCAPTASVVAIAGFIPHGGNAGALWTTVSAASCPGQGLTYRLTQTETSTGAVIYQSNLVVGPLPYTFDHEPVALATTYRVDLVATDSSTGAVVASSSSSPTTPKGKAGGTVG